MRFKVFCIIAGLILSLGIISSAFPQNDSTQATPTETLSVSPAEQSSDSGDDQSEAVEGPDETQPSDQAEEIEEPAPGAPEKSVMPAAKPSQPQKASPTVSFFFDDADIFEVVQTIFADVLKVNYIIDPQVKGRVNFRTVTPIPKSEVLPVMDIIFRLNGIGFVEEAGIYRIVPLKDLPKELVYSQVGKTPENVAIEMFTFKNMDVKEAMPDIENALGLQLQGGSVRIIPIYRMNALIVVASTKSQLEYIKQWVEVFDKMFAVARPKIYVYPLQNSQASHVASMLQAIFTGTAPPASSTPTTTTTTTGSKGTSAVPPPPSAASKTSAAKAIAGGGGFVSADTKVFPDEITNSLIILATPADYSFIEDTIKKIDTIPRQVVIEGLVAQVTLTDNLSFGFAWSLKTNANLRGIKPFGNDINLDGSATLTPQGTTLTASPSTADSFTFVATDPTGNVRAKLAAALTHSKGKVLAAPHIIVLDNREARIQVGSQVPLATSSTTYVSTASDNTVPTTSTIQYKDIGIILKVKPQINDSGLVAIELTQEVSSVGKAATIAGQDYSSIDKTETTTNLIAQDGETIVIGGLIREDTTKQKNGIPLLSSIPLIGNLFSYTKNTKDRTELIILLTPHVIKNEKEAVGVTTDYLDRYKGSTEDKSINEFLTEKSRQATDSGSKDAK